MKEVVVVLLFILNFNGLYSQSISAEFKQDTAFVKQKVRNMIDKDHSTMGMHVANIMLEDEYDKLLNKYYGILYGKLNEAGKKALKETQLNWIKFRDSEKNFVTELGRDTYDKAGGGTMWSVIYGNLKAQIVRDRVFVLYGYLISDGSE